MKIMKKINVVNIVVFKESSIMELFYAIGIGKK